MYKLAQLSVMLLLIFLSGCKSNPSEINNAENTTTDERHAVIPDKETESNLIRINSAQVVIIFLTTFLLFCFLIIYKNKIRIKNLEKNSYNNKLEYESTPEYANQLISLRKLLEDFISEFNTAQNNNKTQSSSTNEAIATLARDLSIREKETQKLFDIISKTDQRKTLARLCSVRETLLYVNNLCWENKMAYKEGMEQLLLEVDSAFSDLGLETLMITPGTEVSALLPGSFNILSSENTDSPQLAGRVKETVTDAIFVKDSNNKHQFISPAKIKVYKL